MDSINSGRENEGQMFDIIRTEEGEVPGGEQEEPNTNIDVEDFLNMTGDGMGEDESDDYDDDGNVVGEVYILINPHSMC